MQYNLFDSFDTEWYKHMEKPSGAMTQEQIEILRKGLEESEITEEKNKD